MFLLPVWRGASVIEEGFERVTDRLQIDNRQETSDLIAICYPFATLAAHDAGMNQIDHLLGPQDDSSPTRSDLADKTESPTPAQPDPLISGEEETPSGTLTNSRAAASLGAAPVESSATWDPSRNRRRPNAFADSVQSLVWQSRAQQGLPQFIEDMATLARVASLVSVRTGRDTFPLDVQERDAFVKAVTQGNGGSRRPPFALARTKRPA